MSTLLQTDLDELTPPAGMPDQQRQALRRLLLALPSYGCAMLLMYASAWLGLLEWPSAHLVAAFAASGLLVFWLLLRSGLTLRWRDPMAVLPQAFFGVLVIALAYHLIETSRSVAMLWLTVIIVYDIQRLPLRHVTWVVALATVCQLANFTNIWLSTPNEDVRLEEILNLGCLALLLPSLALASANARATVRRRKKQNEEMEQTLEALSYLSIHDVLTGLHNRRHMQDMLAQEASKSRRFQRPFSVAILDIDHFKRVNDEHGHACGDAVLKAFARLIEAEFNGPVDAAARWGGEEFLVLMPETAEDLAHARLQALRESVHAFDWDSIKPGLRITFSAGAFMHEYGSIAHSLEQADQALYAAKAQGRDRVLPAVDLSEALCKLRDTHVQSALRRLAAPPAETSWPNFVGASRPAAHADQPPPKKGRLRGTRESIGWQAWIMGSDRFMRQNMQMVMLASGMYLFWLIAVLAYALPRDVYPTWLDATIITHLTLGAIVPPLLIRSRWSVRCKDHSLVAEQIAWGSAMLVASYWFSPFGNGALLAVLCLVIVFGFSALSTQRVRQLGLTVTSMLALSWLGFAWWGEMPRQELIINGLRLTAACTVMLLLTLQSQVYSRFREQYKQERVQLAEAIEQVRRLSTTDTLTGLPNRQHLHEVLDKEAQRTTRHDQNLCLCLIDLDHFKRINDTLGHQVGDEVLAGFARLAVEVLRDIDTVGRWGGEEFLVVMPGGTAAGPQRLIDRIAEAALSAQAPDLRVSFSAGLAQHVHGEPWEATLARADQALYTAKREGRNRCVEAERPD